MLMQLEFRYADMTYDGHGMQCHPRSKKRVTIPRKPGTFSLSPDLTHKAEGESGEGETEFPEIWVTKPRFLSLPTRVGSLRV